ncbi:MAG: transporter [Kiloniellales bacterium]|nr:transporter [Kiloniellales bacterium]
MTRGSPGGIAAIFAFSIYLAASLVPGQALGEEEDAFAPFGLDLKGSLGEGRHDRYVPPITNLIFNETPYITTEARPFYLYNEIPDDFVTDGGNFHLVGLQLRLALTERLGFIATKDGYVDANFDEVLEDEEGFANIALGFKYAVYSEPETESLLTAGLRYEIPIEDLETGGIELQGNGDGFFNPFITGTRTFGDFGLQASLGANIAVDTDEDTSILHYSLHGNYEVYEGLFTILEINGFTAIDNGNRSEDALGQLDGVDALNFGSEDRDTTITLGGGLRYHFTDNIQIGAGGETQLTEDDNTVLDYRAYVDFVFSY